jgi:hypothetical protein
MGRKRKPGIREPNGKLSRRVNEVTRRHYEQLEREEVENMSVGIAVRELRYGVGKEASRDQLLGSFTGRLCSGGQLSRQQYAAAEAYLEAWHNMSRAVRGPRAPGAIDLNATKGGSGDYENVAQAQKAMADWKAASKAIQERQNELRGVGTLNAALYHIVLMDHEFYHLIPSAREALNALARHYRLEGRKAA